MKVLIKEDSSTYRNIFQSYFRKLNFEFTFLEESSQILEILVHDKFDLVILSNPSDSEAEMILNTISTSESFSQIPILLCENELDLEKRRAYLNKGTIYFLKKPFDFENFQEILSLPFIQLRNYESLRILIAEDSEPTQKIMKIYLTKYKLKIDFVSDGEKAIELFLKSEENFHLILTDLNMPNMGGIELAKTIRYALGNLEIPIIFLSGEEDIENSKEFQELGDGWISKPFSNEIYQKLLPYLEKARIYKKNRELFLQHKQMFKFIHTLYNQFERSCTFNVKLLINSIEEIKDNIDKEILKYSIQRIQEELPILQEFLLENASLFEFSNMIKVQHVCNTIIRSLDSIIEHKKIQIISNIQDDLVALKINFILFQFVFHEFLNSFILTLDKNENLELSSNIQDNFLYIKFKTQKQKVKNLPLWILEKIKVEFAILEENEVESYILKFQTLNE